RVDVIAVPIAGRAPGGRTTELLLQGAMVLDVRSETGSPYGAALSKSLVSTVGERIGSVVVAIDALDEVRFADRIATSMFVLALDLVHVRSLPLGPETARLLRGRPLQRENAARRALVRDLLCGVDAAVGWRRRAWTTRDVLRTTEARRVLRPVVFDIAAIGAPP